MFTDDDTAQWCLLVGETFGKAVVDTGCPHTVAGQVWLEGHIDSLSRNDRSSLRTKQSDNRYRFGDGILYPSQYHVIIPIYIGNSRYELGVDIVNCKIPLLLSRETLKRAKAQIDVGNSMMTFLGATVPLTISNSGHMCLQIGRSMDVSNDETKRVLYRVLFSSPMNGVGSDLKNKAAKLHLQFCHPTAERLINLVKNAGTTDERVFDAIKGVTSNCEVCAKNKKPPLKPAVGFTLACEFNQTVALDLKSRGPDLYIMHMIDHLTRYSSACIIRNKRKETIVRGMMDYWIRIFGCPK